MRNAKISRKTRETHIELKVDLDGSGQFDINTGIGFFNHMLELLTRHSMMDVTVNASGDIHVDFHHLVEDTAISLGKAVMQSLGDKRGIYRYGQSLLPMDEALVECALDISGRPQFTSNLHQYSGEIGEFNFELGEVFFSGFASQGFTVHIDIRRGQNLHHIMEGCFKSFAQALRTAISMDERNKGVIPSTKDYIEG